MGFLVPPSPRPRAFFPGVHDEVTIFSARTGWGPFLVNLNSAEVAPVADLNARCKAPMGTSRFITFATANMEYDSKRVSYIGVSGYVSEISSSPNIRNSKWTSPTYNGYLGPDLSALVGDDGEPDNLILQPHPAYFSQRR